MGAALQQLSRLVHDRGRLLPTGQSRLPVSRGTDKLDIFAADVNGNILTSAWEPDFTQWRTWRQAHVTAVSRSTDKLDIFVVSPNFEAIADNPECLPRHGSRLARLVAGLQPLAPCRR